MTHWGLLRQKRTDRQHLIQRQCSNQGCVFYCLLNRYDTDKKNNSIWSTVMHFALRLEPYKYRWLLYEPIATGYGLDGPGFESQWGARFSVPVQTSPGAHPASCTMGTGSFPAVKIGRGVTLTPHPHLVPLVMKE